MRNMAGGLPLRRSLPYPSPTNTRRQRLKVRRQMPISTQALTRPAPASFASPIGSITFRRFAALVSLPRPPIRRLPTYINTPHQRTASTTRQLLFSLYKSLIGIWVTPINLMTSPSLRPSYANDYRHMTEPGRITICNNVVDSLSCICQIA
jgi:hypothetical protein